MRGRGSGHFYKFISNGTRCILIKYKPLYNIFWLKKCHENDALARTHYRPATSFIKFREGGLIYSKGIFTHIKI